MENRHPENVVNNTYRLNTQENEELPDLRALGFNLYEESAIKKGFSRLTPHVDIMNSTGSSLENMHLVLQRQREQSL